MEPKWGNVVLWMMLLVMSLRLRGAVALRFVIDREECFSHKVQYEGDTVHFSFVVIKSDGTWHSEDEGFVDLVVTFSLPLPLPPSRSFVGFFYFSAKLIAMKSALVWS